MKLHAKIYITLTIALLAGFTFFYAKTQTETLLSSHAHVIHNLGEMELLNKTLDEEIWNTAYSLYHNYDEVHRLIKNIRDLAEVIAGLDIVASDVYSPFREEMAQFKILLTNKEQSVLRYATLNSLVKNSVSQIPGLTHRYMKNFANDDQEYVLDLSRATSLVFLASNAMDAELLAGFKEILARLRKREFTDPDRHRFNRVFLSHAQTVERYLSQYISIFTETLVIPTDEAIHNANELFLTTSRRQANEVDLWSWLIMLAFIGSLGLIVFFLISLDRRHAELSNLHEALERSATTDHLTGLKNRFAFERTLSEGVDQSLLIINIDGFKHINNFYGHEAGDSILKQLTGVLQGKLEASKHRLFRLGGDDFGILMDQAEETQTPFARDLIYSVESASFVYADNHVPVNVTAGLSTTRPLLETANQALKQIKHTRTKLLVYSRDNEPGPSMKNNLEIIRILKQAISHDAVKPYYMPIMDNRTQRIARYECLIRVEDDHHGILHPEQFLSVAREGRLSAKLTQIMIEKSFEAFADTGFEFSVNLAIEDLLDAEVMSFLFQHLERFPKLGKQLILEILESEEVKNYQVIADFVKRSASYGVRIAIDDFGSGYSNLRHLLELNIHSLKIDGSLIRHINDDVHAAQTVSAITTLAHKIGITSIVAEYVCSEEILEVVSEMGIDYSQGYHIGRPLPHLLRPSNDRLS